MSVKATTGLAGMPVSRNPRRTLCMIYEKILRTLCKIPDDAAYKKYTEEIILHRLSVIKENESTDVIECTIKCGQVEELIVQANNELSLARNFLNLKPWEPLVQQPPPNQWTWPLNK